MFHTQSGDLTFFNLRVKSHHCVVLIGNWLIVMYVTYLTPDVDTGFVFSDHGWSL